MCLGWHLLVWGFWAASVSPCRFSLPTWPFRTPPYSTRLKSASSLAPLYRDWPVTSCCGTVSSYLNKNRKNSLSTNKQKGPSHQEGPFCFVGSVLTQPILPPYPPPLRRPLPKPHRLRQEALQLLRLLLQLSAQQPQQRLLLSFLHFLQNFRHNRPSGRQQTLKMQINFSWFKR